MAFDYDKLRGRIIEKFRTQGNFSRVLGVSERTLSLKLNNKIFFSQDEIAKISELLNITLDEIQIYFFNKKVQWIELCLDKHKKIRYEYFNYRRGAYEGELWWIHSDLW